MEGYDIANLLIWISTDTSNFLTLYLQQAFYPYICGLTIFVDLTSTALHDCPV